MTPLDLVTSCRAQQDRNLHHLLPAFNIQQARETVVAGFLMQCDSSRITLRHSYERRPEPFEPNLLFEARSSPWIVPSAVNNDVQVRQ